VIAVIVFLGLYPQLALHRSEVAVKAAVAPAEQAEADTRALAGNLPGGGRIVAEGGSEGSVGK
jgi:hypothetical protein